MSGNVDIFICWWYYPPFALYFRFDNLELFILFFIIWHYSFKCYLATESIDFPDMAVYRLLVTIWKKFKAFSINLSIHKIVTKFFMHLWFFEVCEQSLNPRRIWVHVSLKECITVLITTISRCHFSHYCYFLSYGNTVLILFMPVSFLFMSFLFSFSYVLVRYHHLFCLQKLPERKRLLRNIIKNVWIIAHCFLIIFVIGWINHFR